MLNDILIKITILLNLKGLRITIKWEHKWTTKITKFKLNNILNKQNQIDLIEKIYTIEHSLSSYQFFSSSPIFTSYTFVISQQQ